MKVKKFIQPVFFIFLCLFAFSVLASGLSHPSTAQAQGRRTNTPVPPPTNTKPIIIKTKAPPSDTPSPTATNTSTLFPTFTPSNTPTITPSPTSTNTPTFTPTFTPTPFPNEVKLNEVLPKAQFEDWNKDGVESADDQWVEVFNSSDHPADVSGWRIDTGVDTPSFLIPNETIIQPGGFVIFFRSETQLNLDRFEHLRLLFPDGDISDEVEYPALESDRVYARLVDGRDPWRDGCVPTPLSPNCQAAESFSSQFNLPFFQRAIRGPEEAFQDPEVTVTNLLLAIILALAIGFFSNLLNDAIETHEDNYARLFGPIVTPLNRLRSNVRNVNKVVSRSRNPWLGFIIKTTILLIIYGTILAYLDPSFQFVNQDGILLIIALGFSTGLVAMIDDLAIYFYLRAKGGGAAVRLHSSNLLMVILTTVFSRMTELVPGLLLGSPAGIEDVPEELNGPHLDILAIVVTTVTGLAAWTLSSLAVDPWLNTIFVLTFGAGIQTAFFEMLPLSYLRGKSIFKFNPFVWLVLFVGTTALFFQTMLNPDGPFLSAFLSANMMVLSVFTVLYCAVCAMIWFFLTRAEKSS